MNPDSTVEREDAISFGEIDAQAEEERREKEEQGLREGDRDPNTQGISNRPGDTDPDEGVNPEPGNNA
jgi:hypothetical protein